MDLNHTIFQKKSCINPNAFWHSYLTRETSDANWITLGGGDNLRNFATMHVLLPNENHAAIATSKTFSYISTDLFYFIEMIIINFHPDKNNLL